MGPIAVFDSGVGGLSVLRELVAQMPSEHFLYFGDSANAPMARADRRNSFSDARPCRAPV